MTPEEINGMETLLSKKKDQLKENEIKQVELMREYHKIYDEIFDLRSNIVIAKRTIEKCQEVI